jgi:hypothetical protein
MKRALSVSERRNSSTCTTCIILLIRRRTCVCLAALFSFHHGLLLVSYAEASSSGFPGTLQGSSENWWSSPFESSSSDWEWEDADDDRTSSDVNAMLFDEDDLFPDTQNKTSTTALKQKENKNPTSSAPSNNKPLQTLEKLQQMLDETDYLTTGRQINNNSNNNSNNNNHNTHHQNHPRETQELWTSKDRSKYKKQQKRRQRPPYSNQRAAETTQSTTFQPPPPQLPEASSAGQQQHQWYTPPVAVPPPATMNTPMELPTFDAETTELSETDGDGLGYTLPNLPVYLSDDEDEGNESDPSISTMTTTTTTPKPQAQPLVSQQPPPYYVPPPPLQQQQQQQQQSLQQQQQQQQWPSYGYPYPYSPPTTTANAEQPSPQQYYPWPPPPPSYYYHPRQYVPRIDTTRRPLHHYQQQHHHQLLQQQSIMNPVPQNTEPIPTTTMAEGASSSSSTQPYSFAVSSKERKPARLIASLLRMGTCMALAMFLSYSAVFPGHHLTMYEFNQKVYSVLKLVAWTSMPPLAIFWLGIVDVVDDSNTTRETTTTVTNKKDATIMDEEDEEPIRRRNPHKTTVATLISAFYNAFTWGYCLLFGLQIAVTTFIRLAIFFRWERPVFDMTPHIPLVIVPWVLREHGYKPKRITLIVQDFVTSCLLCPILEEYTKLVLLQMTKLPKNFQWRRAKHKRGYSHNNKNRLVAEPILDQSEEVINVNAYVSNMLAVTLGIKLADSIRRVCMYTKPQHSAKTFYAIFRGIFPVRELCGTATALALARRDVLGQRVPLWNLLLPACVIHGMANFRGMKVSCAANLFFLVVFYHQLLRLHCFCSQSLSGTLPRHG